MKADLFKLCFGFFLISLELAGNFAGGCKSELPESAVGETQE